MRILFLLLCFLSTSSIFADTGYAYRFNIEVTLNNSEKINGYIYVYSWEKYESNDNLHQFLLKNVPNQQLKIYPHIITVISDFLNLDFTLKNSKRSYNLNEISKLKNFDFLSFGGGTFRLKELSETEFKLIQTNKPYSKTLNVYNLVEYCHLVFFDWKNPINKSTIEEIKNKLKLKKEELENNLEGENSSQFYRYFNELKSKLIDENILLIMYCESC